MKSKEVKPADFALKLLAIRDYGGMELKKRMETKGFSSSESDVVIEMLKSKNLLDDEKLISKLIDKYTVKAPASREFIRAALETKGFKREQFDAVLDEIDEISTARRAFRMKFGVLKTLNDPLKLRQKAANYLQTKGFDYDIIDQILNEEIKGGTDFE
jgi:SOS response regulatory protein OraA/RecX